MNDERHSCLRHPNKRTAYIMLSDARDIHRVAVGLLWQETNAFNPVMTDASQFVFHRGNDLIAAYEHTETALGGIIRRLRERGLAPVPVLAARARPGGPIDDETVEHLLEEMTSGIVAAKADAVCLELHGSMTGVTVDDFEGSLLARLRRVLGPDVPIVAALDLHGHVTPLMVQSANILTSYRTHPHLDMAETGARAVDLLFAATTSHSRPVAVRRTVPMLALWQDETDQPGMRAVRELLAREWASRPGILDVSVFNTHPFLDLPGMGQVVLVYAKPEQITEATALADRVASELWRQRDAFSGRADDLATVFAGTGAGKTIAIGDQGDSVLAGAPGDSVEIARYAYAHLPDARGLIPVFDPDAVAACTAACPGAEIVLDIGARYTPGLKPLSVRGTVQRLTDGCFANEGAYMTGVVNDLGSTAILKSRGLLFMITSKSPGPCDPAMASHAGTSLAELDFIVVKSSNHFRLSLADQCWCRVAATPGLTSRNPDELKHRRARPIYPIDKQVTFTKAEEGAPQ